MQNSTAELLIGTKKQKQDGGSIIRCPASFFPPAGFRAPMCVLFLFCSLVDFSQGWKRNIFSNSAITVAASSRNAIETTPGSYIAVGFSIDTLNNKQFNKLTLMGLDASGNKTWQNDYGSAAFEYLDNLLAAKIAIWKDSAAFFMAGPVHDTVTCTALTKFSFSGNILWQKIYRDGYHDLVAQGVTRGADRGLLITGYSLDTTTHTQPAFVLKTDRNGNELWRKKIHKPIPDVSAGNGIQEDSATRRIVIAGFQNTSSGACNRVMILDSIGNKLSDFSTNNPGAGGSIDLIQLHDRSFMTASIWYEYTSGSDFYKLRLSRFDCNSTISWQKKYFVPSPYNGNGSLVEYAAGKIAVLGSLDTMSVLNLQPDQRSIVYTIDTSGNVLSTKLLDLAGTPYDDIGLSISKTSDGGMIIASDFDGRPGNTPYRIIKLDDELCDTTAAACALFATGMNKENLPAANVLYFPEPVYEMLYIRVAGGSGCTAEIVDCLGRVVNSYNSESGTDLSCDLRSLTGGVYFVRLLCSGIEYPVHKIIVASH